MISGFVVLGCVVAVVLLTGMIRGPVTATLADYHLSYASGTNAGAGIIAAYVLATCGAVLFSGRKYLMVFGIVNLLAVGVLARYEIEGFASLWCAWAAVTAGCIALYMRMDHPAVAATAESARVDVRLLATDTSRGLAPLWSDGRTPAACRPHVAVCGRIVPSAGPKPLGRILSPSQAGDG